MAGSCSSCTTAYPCRGQAEKGIAGLEKKLGTCLEETVFWLASNCGFGSLSLLGVIAAHAGRAAVQPELPPGVGGIDGLPSTLLASATTTGSNCCVLSELPYEGSVSADWISAVL